ncbi:MAG: STAS domain-containing protein [Candidatus Eisenbacteria bacterium]|nr:STAS domain-containing protein [Candidatus Eisenbacteria bacterium]
MELKEKKEGDVVILYPKGYLMGGPETVVVEKRIRQLAEEENKKLVINLEETNHLNSTALGVLIAGYTNYAKRNASMKLCKADKKIHNIFVITKLSLVFEVFETEKEAVASF